MATHLESPVTAIENILSPETRMADPVRPADFQESQLPARKPGKSNSQNNNDELSSRCQVSRHHLLPLKLLVGMDTVRQCYCTAKNIIFPPYSFLPISSFSLFSAFPRGCSAFSPFLFIPYLFKNRLSTRRKRPDWYGTTVG